MTHQTSNSQPGSTASSASSVPISMSSPQHQNPPQTQQQLQYNGGYIKQSPCASPDMTVGSLPNMHSPMAGHQQFKGEFLLVDFVYLVYFSRDTAPILLRLRIR